MRIFFSSVHRGSDACRALPRRANYTPPAHPEEFDVPDASSRLQIAAVWLTALALCLGVGFATGSFEANAGASVGVAASADPGTLGATGNASAEVGEPGLVALFPPVSIESLPVHGRSLDPEPKQRSLTVVTQGTLRRGESLSIALSRQGIDSETIHAISREFSGVFDFRHARPGDEYRLGQEAGGEMVDFRYSVNPEKSYYLYQGDAGYRVREDRSPLRAEIAKVSGEIESSLYGTVKELGERAQLASDFADIFAWDIDFSRSVQPGDDFQILYERLYRTNPDGEEVYVKPGRILAARYSGRGGDHSAVYFKSEKGRGRYFRSDGTSVERAFLVAPLKFSRISSSYTSARRHPILNVVRPHRGIDYAAAHGTPLWSVGSGRVIFRGWAGASGNLLKIKHRNGYVSYYAHLSRFEPGLAVGSEVEQKQIIGYVGDTGLATGPHVCFRVQKNGRYVNPLDISTPAGDPVASADRLRFESARDLLFADLGSGMQMAADEAL